MSKVERDEFGPVITLADKEGGLRPAGKTKLREGDEIDTYTYHFGGSTLHGVGKVTGRGMYQEVWMSAPEPKKHYNDRQDRWQRVDFDLAMEIFLSKLATLRRAAPDFDNKMGPHQIENLKEKMEKMGSLGQAFGQNTIWKELVSEGKMILSESLADSEADLIAEDTRQSKKTSRGPRC